MNMHGMYNYLSFAWPFQPVVLDVLHWYIAWDRIWLRLHRAYKLETCVNGSSSLLYTRLSILALELPRGFHREQNGREQPLKRSKYYLKPTKIQYYFSKVLGPNLQFYLFCPECLCRCRSGFFRTRRSECWVPQGLICVLPTVLNALRPIPRRYKGASLSLKSNLIRITPMTLNLPLSNYL